MAITIEAIKKALLSRFSKNKASTTINEEYGRIQKGDLLVEAIPQRRISIKRYRARIKSKSRAEKNAYGRKIIRDAVKNGLIDNYASEVKCLASLELATQWAKNGYKKIRIEKYNNAIYYNSWKHVLRVLNPRYFEQDYYPLEVLYGAVALYIRDEVVDTKISLKEDSNIGITDCSNAVNDSFYNCA